MIGPILEDIAAEMGGRVRIAKLNIDENPVTTNRFNIQSIPALLFFRGGREVDRLVGARPKAEITRRLEDLLAA
jgi:thioredoxin-like negative regulator of GroEL